MPLGLVVCPNIPLGQMCRRSEKIDPPWDNVWAKVVEDGSHLEEHHALLRLLASLLEVTGMELECEGLKGACLKKV